MVETTITINHPVGLHARPAVTFVQTASKFQSKIMLTNLTRNSSEVNAKSIVSVVKAAVAQGHTIRLMADGDDAQAAIDTLTQLIVDNFGEAV
jgi:phosphotransferase system HPr (HPr) family protein